jgi:NADH-quinone oxidoreductase subunit E
MLSEDTRNKIEGLKGRYPGPRSALIPALQLVQAQFGWLPPEAMSDLAAIFALSANEVYEVASFYTMLYKKPVGKYVIQVCTNIACLLCDCEQLMNHLQRRLGIKPGETTPDGKFTLLEVECLASCGTAPVVQINDDYHEDLNVEKLDRILDSLS